MMERMSVDDYVTEKSAVVVISSDACVPDSSHTHVVDGKGTGMVAYCDESQPIRWVPVLIAKVVPGPLRLNGGNLGVDWVSSR